MVQLIRLRYYSFLRTELKIVSVSKNENYTFVEKYVKKYLTSFLSPCKLKLYFSYEAKMRREGKYEEMDKVDGSLINGLFSYDWLRYRHTVRRQ